MREIEKEGYDWYKKTQKNGAGVLDLSLKIHRLLSL